MTWTTDQLRKLIELAYGDVKAQLFYAIENIPEERPTLLHQLDVLNQVKERLNGRLDYPNPLSTD